MLESSDQSVRGRILEAAGVEFGRSGLHGARTRAICHAAGVNVSTLHYHFGSKEQLFAAVVTRAAAQMAGVLHAVQAGPSNDLPTLVAEMAAFFAHQPDAPRVLLQAMLEHWDGQAGVLDAMANTIREVATPLDDATRPHLNPRAVVLTAGSLLATMGLLDPIRQRLGDVTAWDVQTAIVGMFEGMFESNPGHTEAAALEAPAEVEE